ncbi:MAG: 23S rRNA (guanosine(2251)-2'-O)-methyltransferase RlmB [Bacteriovoracia bacterium]
MASRIILSSLRSIEECLTKNPERVSKLLVSTGKLSPRVSHLKSLAEKSGIKVEFNPETNNAESALAVLKDYQYKDFSSVVQKLKEEINRGARPIVIALDGLSDPQNLGAILRTAAFMGVSAVILPKDRSVSITDVVYNVASGGLEHVNVSQVVNMASSLEELKEAGFWIVGFSENAEQDLNEIRQDFAPVIVIGNEEKGMRPLVTKLCDFQVKLSPKGGLKSLNASVAAALAMAWATKIISSDSNSMY